MPVCLTCGSTIRSCSTCPRCASGGLVSNKAQISRVILVTSDSGALENLFAGPSRLHPLVRCALRRKLQDAALVLPHDVPPSVATLNSRVTYQIADNAVETRILVLDEAFYTPGQSLLVTTPAGVTLLGLAEGEQADIPSAGGRPRSLRLISVDYQPQQAHRRFFRQNADTLGKRPRVPGSAGAAIVPFAPRIAEFPDGPGDDPGPIAA